MIDRFLEMQVWILEAHALEKYLEKWYAHNPYTYNF